MSVARVIAARIAVMYLGNVVEISTADAVIDKPLHPYTKALLEASPTIDPSLKDVMKKIGAKEELTLSTSHPAGCKFHPRCPFVMSVCKDTVPQLKEVQPGHWVSCWLY
jgi:peptide/nickel transport system ATP-binding protein